MANNSEIEVEATSPTNHGQAGKDWGAQDSLRRNAGLNKGVNDEVTPLLGSGSASGDSGDGNGQTGWSGHADFEGLTWWQRPSVSYYPNFWHGRVLTFVDVLAAAALLPFRPRIRWSHRSKA
jgi:hypothetical protein